MNDEGITANGIVERLAVIVEQLDKIRCIDESRCVAYELTTAQTMLRNAQHKLMEGEL